MMAFAERHPDVGIDAGNDDNGGRFRGSGQCVAARILLSSCDDADDVRSGEKWGVIFRVSLRNL